MTSLAANVRRLRTRKKMTQEAFAEAAGLDASYIQRIERAAVNVTIVVLVQLADALGVPPGALLKKAAPVPRSVGRPKTTTRASKTR